MKVFKSGISLGVFIPLILVLSVSSWIVLDSESSTGLIIVFSIQIIAIAAMLDIGFRTTYSVSDSNKLIIRCGLFYNSEIDIKEIRSIKKTSELSSAPALSFDRIELKYSQTKSVILSPKDKSYFIEELLRVNPTIQS